MGIRLKVYSFRICFLSAGVKSECPDPFLIRLNIYSIRICACALSTYIQNVPNPKNQYMVLNSSVAAFNDSSARAYVLDRASNKAAPYPMTKTVTVT